MTPFIYLMLCFAAFCCLFMFMGMLLFVTDLLGWTCFWIVEPFNERQMRKYQAMRRKMLRTRRHF